MLKFKHLLTMAAFGFALSALADADDLPSLHIEDNKLVDSHGNNVVLHGVMDTPNPYFNEYRWGSDATDAYRTACIEYFDELFTAITDSTQGAYCNFFRLHLDPCWTNDPDIESTGTETGEANISQFSSTRLKTYLSTLYWKIIDEALGHGLYVVVRPPGVCPEGIKVGGYYQDYLMTVWDIVSSNSNFKKYSGQVSIELANEPVNIFDEDSLESASAAHDFFQPIVDMIRANGFTGIIWVPGTSWQSNYTTYQEYPIEGYNIGYAAHCYVGWYNCSDGDTTTDQFIEEFYSSVPVLDTNPVIITEVDWSPEASDVEGHTDEQGNEVEGNLGTWATGTTSGWGNAFMEMCEYYDIGVTLSGTACYIDIDQYLEDGTVEPAFDGEPEACGQACFDWYAECSTENFPYPDFVNVTTNTLSNGKKFINPVISADFPDPDVVRIDDTYYMASTTMHLFPGGTILKSYDLVNWEYCCNPLEQLSTDDKYCLLNGENSYAEGSWACALAVYEGTMYMLINGNDCGGFVLYTDDPEGTWTMKELDRSYYDPGMLIEDDKVYVASGIGDIYINTLNMDFEYQSSTCVIEDRDGLEGSRLYKIGDYYYVYATYGGWPSGQAIFRSTDINGTYEEQMLIEKYIDGEVNTVHQGALVETQTGEWWTMLMEDLGAIGRLPSLHPVEWEDGWPILCDDGVPQATYTVPDVGSYYMATTLPTTDNFREYPINDQWQWNHNPDDGCWTLFENPGYLRLYTASVTDDFMQARNTLTQRIFAYHNTKSPYGLSEDTPSMGTICLNVANMIDGDKAGIALQQDPYAYIAVVMKDGKKYLEWHQDTLENVDDFTPATVEETSVEIGDVIYLRAQFQYGTSVGTFYYSLDNETYTQLGEELTMSYNLSVFVGVRFAIFNFATIQQGGYVDVDWFTTEEEFTEDMFYDPDFEGYSEDMLTAVSVVMDEDDLEVMVGQSSSLTITATYADGHTENVASQAKYTISDEDVLTITSGLIKGKKDGEVAVTAVYTDPMGNEFTLDFTATSTYFPFSEEYISVFFGDGTYKEAQKAFFPGQYGQIGWEYSSGADFSEYKYAVFNLSKSPSFTVAIDMYPTSSIWGNCYSQNFEDDALQLVVPLETITYTSGDDTGERFNTSNVCIVAVWADGSGAVRFDDAYLTNNEDYTRESTTGINMVNVDNSSDGDDAIYNLQGIKVTNPSKGVYIQNGRKLIIK